MGTSIRITVPGWALHASSTMRIGTPARFAVVSAIAPLGALFVLLGSAPAPAAAEGT